VRIKKNKTGNISRNSKYFSQIFRQYLFLAGATERLEGAYAFLGVFPLKEIFPSFNEYFQYWTYLVK
jgi:hypothetical protein